MRKAWIAVLGIAVAGLAALWVASGPRRAVASGDPAVAEGAGDPARGAIVFNAGGCASCHAAPAAEGTKPDRTRLGGGLRIKTGFGTFVVPNISQDKDDGIGGWRTADLANALLAGVAPDGSHYFPAFPYTTYAHMKVGDVVDLMAYLRTLPAVAGRQPPHDLAFPFNQRRLLGLWKILYLDRSPVEPVPVRDDTWNRGRYLVEALGHCAECHSPRNVLGAIVTAQRFAGGPDPEGRGFIPNITPAQGGLAKWSEADLVEVLTSGNTPDFDNVSGSMSEVVANTAALSEADRAAIATYIHTLAPVATPPHAAKK